MFSPFGSPDEDRSARWHPEPQFRGTFGIFSSCIITISLCVWTALHLNIPEHDKHKRKVWPSRTFWRKTGWLVMGLFAPEMVAWTAYEQYREAQKVYAFMLGALNQQPSPSWFTRLWDKVCQRRRDGRDSEPALSDIELEEGMAEPIAQNEQEAMDRSTVLADGIGSLENKQASSKDAKSKTFSTHIRNPWTMTHSYYFVMGGYAMDDSDSDQKFMPKYKPRFVLETKDLQRLIENDICILPDLSESQIRDKSKASGLAKTLVCTQAIWFCVQCIVRLSQNLTICLLELNTFAHAVCALLIYLLWWSKPLDVEEPSLLVGELKDEYSAARACRLVGSSKGGRSSIFLPLDMTINIRPEELRHTTSFLATFILDQPKGGHAGQSIVQSGPKTLRKDENISCWVYSGVLRRPDTYLQSIYEEYFGEVCFELDSRFLRRLELCATVAFQCDFDYALTLPLRVRNWPSTDFLNMFDLDKDGLRLMCGFTMAGLIYGGIHLCAWNAIFSSGVQTVLWQVSSVTLATSGASILIAALAGRGLIRLKDWKDRYFERTLSWSIRERLAESVHLIFSGGLLVLVACFALLYVFARVYLVVECFLSLAHLPPSAFKVPVWSQYVPHIV